MTEETDVATTEECAPSPPMCMFKYILSIKSISLVLIHSKFRSIRLPLAYTRAPSGLSDFVVLGLSACEAIAEAGGSGAGFIV